jgi:hypothetical protein
MLAIPQISLVAARRDYQLAQTTLAAGARGCSWVTAKANNPSFFELSDLSATLAPAHKP